MMTRWKTGLAPALLAMALALTGATTVKAQESSQPEESGETPVFHADPIVVESSARREQSSFDSPDAISVMMRERFEQRLPQDVGDAIHSAPGVYIQHTSAGQASPFVRGLTGRQLLVLVDGVRFSNSAFRDGPNQYFSSIDPRFVERVEVVRGPFSVLYGSDALGGAINIISRKPSLRETSGFDAEPGIILDYASANRGKRGTLDLPFGVGQKFSAYASATYSDYDQLTGGAGIGRQPFTEFEDYSVTGGFRWQLSDAWSLDWRLNHKVINDLYRTDKNTTLVADPAALPTDGNGDPRSADDLRIFPAQEDTFTTISLGYQGSGVFKWMRVDAMYHRVNEELNRITRGSTTLRDQYFTVDTLGLTATALLDWGDRSRLTVGVDIYHDTIKAGRTDEDLTTGVRTPRPGSGQFPDGDSTYTAFGVYAQDEIMLMDGALELRPGVRFSFYQADAQTSDFDPGLDDVSTSFSDVTGALSLTWRPNDWLAPIVSVGRGFRAPNLDDLAASKNTGSGDEIPNPDLRPEELLGAQLGAKVYLRNDNAASAAPHRLRADAFYFEHWMFDAAVKQDTTFNGNNVVRVENTGRARINGWEVSAEYYFGSELESLGGNSNYLLEPGDALAIWGDATYTHGDDLSAEVPFARIPPLHGRLGLRYEGAHRSYYIEPWVEMWDKQERRNPSKNGDPRFAKPHTPGYTLFNLAAGWTLSEHMRLRLVINNITNKDYQVLGSGVFGSGTDVRLGGEFRW